MTWTKSNYLLTAGGNNNNNNGFGFLLLVSQHELNIMISHKIFPLKLVQDKFEQLDMIWLKYV